MPIPAMTGDPNLQQYLKDQYRYYRDQGYSKRDAHSLSFQDMLQARENGYIQDDTPSNQDPVLEVVYSDDPGF